MMTLSPYPLLWTPKTGNNTMAITSFLLLIALSSVAPLSAMHLEKIEILNSDHSVQHRLSCMTTGASCTMDPCGKNILGIVLPSPQRTLEAQMCCNIAGSSYRTAKFSIVALGPSKTRPGQTDYMCTVYSSDATLISGNKSITAAQATSLPPPPPPPTPPKCVYTTAHTCIMSGKRFWSAGKCSPTPPSSLLLPTIGVFNQNWYVTMHEMTLFDSDPSSTNSSEIMAPSQYKAGVLGNFNWSFGVVNNVTRKNSASNCQTRWERALLSISTGLVKKKQPQWCF